MGAGIVAPGSLTTQGRFMIEEKRQLRWLSGRVDIRSPNRSEREREPDAEEDVLDWPEVVRQWDYLHGLH